MQNVSITLQRILRSVVDKGGSPVNINQLVLIIRRTEDKQCNCTSRKNFSKSIIITSSNYFEYSRVFPGRRSRQQLNYGKSVFNPLLFLLTIRFLADTSLAKHLSRVEQTKL